jgi:hypothetical protein
VTIDNTTLAAILFAAAAFTAFHAIVVVYCKGVNNRTKVALQECINTLLATESLWNKIQTAMRAPNPEVEKLREALNECAAPIRFHSMEHPQVYLTELRRRQAVATLALGKEPVTKPTVVT